MNASGGGGAQHSMRIAGQGAAAIRHFAKLGQCFEARFEIVLAGGLSGAASDLFERQKFDIALYFRREKMRVPAGAAIGRGFLMHSG